jgi:hypothetical protein
MHTFTAALEIIGVNPFVQVPEEILADIFVQAGTVNGLPYQQTLVRYAGLWRLYINLLMLVNSPRRIGEVLAVTIDYNPAPAPVLACPAFEKTLAETPEAQEVFGRLSPSRQHELVRYLARLKGEETLVRNLERAVGFLLGKNRFVGRDYP